MPSTDTAVLRLKALLNELDKIGQSDFPYPDSREALSCIRTLVTDDLQLLESFSSDSDDSVVSQQISVSLRHARIYLPLLGFILRSTNIRNAFEVYGPLRRLARKLHPSAKLVLSSEWQESPFVYTHVEAFPEIALIGLPATESSNALLVPLAGHELGHVIWSREQVNDRLRNQARRKALDVVAAQRTNLQIAYPELNGVTGDIETNLQALPVWSSLQKLAMAQVEESFCDVVGTRIFGASYLRAFDYLLSGYNDAVSIRYPPLRTRAELIYDAAASFGVELVHTYSSREDFVNRFEQVDYSAQTTENVKRKAVHSIMEELCRTLPSQVDLTITRAGVMIPDEAEVERIKKRLQKQVPASQCTGLPEVINAGWRAAADPHLWSKIPTLGTRRRSVLNELILKTIEVLDVEQILAETDGPSS